MDEFDRELDLMRAAHLDVCADTDCTVCAAIWRAARAEAEQRWMLDHEAECSGCVVCSLSDDDGHAVIPVD